jgi:protein TonB
MFETSLIESSGQLKSRSSRYMWITGTFNAVIVAAMIVVPLLYPEALPKTAMTAMLLTPQAPRPPHVQPKTVTRAVKTAPALNALIAPTRVPTHIVAMHEDPPALAVEPGVVGMATMTEGGAGPAGAMTIGAAPLVVKVAAPKVVTPAHISSGVIAGNKLSGTTPVYSAIAKAAHVSGAVVLHAVISKTGTIESLAVVSGPEMLRANAVSAVQDWRYRPYLLNGEPTEVDTTITVNFLFGG